jgi:hypothetical protein
MIRVKNILTVATVALVTSASVVLHTPTAMAGPRAANNPSACVSAWHNADDYRGEGWVGATVTTQGKYKLGCGDELSGVIHIVGLGTGTGHPIPETQEDQFLICWRTTISRAKPTTVGKRLLFKWGKARAWVDKERSYTYTFYTATGGQGNAWSACASAASGGGGGGGSW